MTTNVAPLAPVRVYGVLLSKKAEVDAYLTKLAKRCAKKGLDALVWTWGKAVTTVETRDFAPGNVPPGARMIPGHLYPATGAVTPRPYHVDVTRVPLTFVTKRPHFNGWTFAATLQHLDGENIVRTIPGCTVHEDCAALPSLGQACAGVDLPVLYRTRGPVCDHCKHKRRRNDTYVLHHHDGRYVQVGSTCIADFLGSKEAEKMAAKAEILALASGAAEGGEDGDYRGGSGTTGMVALAPFLTAVAWCVREIGWRSRTTAREEGGQATADLASSFLWHEDAAIRAGYEPSEDDTACAEAAELWAESLTDEEIEVSQGDYLHNVRVVARMGFAEFRTVGIAGSIVVAYQRFIGRQRERQERAARLVFDGHVGTVGTRTSWGLPQATNKNGTPKKGAPVALDAEPVTLDFVTGYESDFGYTTVCTFRTAAGAKLVWKAGSTELSRQDVGKRYTLVGTIKAHGDYKGTKQTILSRCDATEVAG